MLRSCRSQELSIPLRTAPALMAGAMVLMTAVSSLAGEVSGTPKPAVEVKAAPECSSCTRRHQALARSKKARAKETLVPKLESKAAPAKH